MMTRRQMLKALGATGAIAGAGSAWLMAPWFQKFLDEGFLYTLSACALLRHDPATSCFSSITLNGLSGAARGAEILEREPTDFEVLFFHHDGRLAERLSRTVEAFSTATVHPPVGFRGSMLVLLRCRARVGLAPHSEAGVFISHRTPWGEDGHHGSQWSSSLTGFGLITTSPRTQSVIAGTSLHAESINGRLLITRADGSTVMDRQLDWPAFSTITMTAGSDAVAFDDAWKLPADEGALLVRFLSQPERTITFNAWTIHPGSPGSFTAYHGVHGKAEQRVKAPPGLEDLVAGTSIHAALQEFSMVPADVACWSRTPTGEKARSTIYLPNLSATPTRVSCAFGDANGRIFARPRRDVWEKSKAFDIAPGGIAILPVSTALFEVDAGVPDFSSAVIHFGSPTVPQSIGKILTVTDDGSRAWMQHARPRELWLNKEQTTFAARVSGGFATDYWLPYPNEGRSIALIRQYGDRQTTDAELFLLNESGVPKRLSLPVIPAGGFTTLAIDESFVGLRLSSSEAGLKLLLFRRDAKDRWSAAHGTHRISSFTAWDEAPASWLAAKPKT